MTSKKEHNKKIKNLKFKRDLYKKINEELKILCEKVENDITEKSPKKIFRCNVYSSYTQKSYGMRIIYKVDKKQYIIVFGEKIYITNTKISKNNNLYKEV